MGDVQARSWTSGSMKGSLPGPRQQLAKAAPAVAAWAAQFADSGSTPAALQTRVLHRQVAGEEADDRPRAAGRVGLAPPERGEDGVARVLLRPRDGEAAGIRPHLVPDLPRGRRVVVPLPARPAALGDAARGAVVVVGRADEAEPEGVHAELLLEREAVLQRVTDHVAERVAVDRGRLLAGQLVRLLLLLERAQLVRRPCPGARQAVEAALRVALDLVQLDERLERLAAERLVGVGGIEPLLAG